MSNIKWNPLNVKMEDAPGTVIIGKPGNGHTFYMVNGEIISVEEYNKLMKGK